MYPLGKVQVREGKEHMLGALGDQVRKQWVKHHTTAHRSDVILVRGAMGQATHSPQPATISCIHLTCQPGACQVNWIVARPWRIREGGATLLSRALKGAERLAGVLP
jgi:hypothetical protein